MNRWLQSNATTQVRGWRSGSPSGALFAVLYSRRPLDRNVLTLVNTGNGFAVFDANAGKDAGGEGREGAGCADSR